MLISIILPSSRNEGEYQLQHDGIQILLYCPAKCLTNSHVYDNIGFRFKSKLSVIQVQYRHFQNNAQFFRSSSDRNFALAHFMKENHAFPGETDVGRIMDLYFQVITIF